MIRVEIKATLVVAVYDSLMYLAPILYESWAMELERDPAFPNAHGKCNKGHG